ncbi:unnamed protein product [Amoebophrya sp. A120]|nr:unnamed protein product [Amoebophrya sp. A120]|eukprot:GSA120T00011801001.1
MTMMPTTCSSNDNSRTRSVCGAALPALRCFLRDQLNVRQQKSVAACSPSVSSATAKNTTARQRYKAGRTALLERCVRRPSTLGALPSRTRRTRKHWMLKIAERPVAFAPLRLLQQHQWPLANLILFLCAVAAGAFLLFSAVWPAAAQQQQEGNKGRGKGDDQPKFDLGNTKKYVEELIGDGKLDKAIHILHGLRTQDLDSAQKLAKLYMQELKFEEALKVLRENILQLQDDEFKLNKQDIPPPPVFTSKNPGDEDDEEDSMEETETGAEGGGTATSAAGGEKNDQVDAPGRPSSVHADQDVQHDRRAAHMYPEAWNNMGYAYEKLNQLDKAVEAYITATRLRPMEAGYWYNLGTCLLKTGLAQHQAISSLEKAHQLAPEDELITVNLGIATQNLNLLQSSNTAKGQQVLGQLLWQQGNRADAVTAFQKAQKLEPSDPDIAFQCALVRYQTRRPSANCGLEADEVVRTACEQQKRLDRNQWRKEFAQALSIRKSADTLRYGDKILDASFLTFLIRGTSAKTVRRMRKQETDKVRPSVAQKIDKIREGESDPAWQARFAMECVDTLGQVWNEDINKVAADVGEDDELDEQAGKTKRQSSAPSPELFPAACGYGIIWSTSWHRVHMRLEDGAAGEDSDYRHITENWSVVVVGGGRGGGCAYPWIRNRECLVVDVLCDLFKKSGEGFFCRHAKTPASRRMRHNNDRQLHPSDVQDDRVSTPGSSQPAGTGKSTSNKASNDSSAASRTKALERQEDNLSAYLQYQDSETINKLTGLDLVEVDPRYYQFVKENKVGTVILETYFWPAATVREEVEFWVKVLPISADLFVFEKDYMANRPLLDEHFKVLYRHGMEVSWLDTPVEMLQLQKRIDKLREAFDKRALDDIARMEERWREEKEAEKWRITEMVRGRGRANAYNEEDPFAAGSGAGTNSEEEDLDDEFDFDDL